MLFAAWLSGLCQSLLSPRAGKLGGQEVSASGRAIAECVG